MIDPITLVQKYNKDSYLLLPSISTSKKSDVIAI